MASSVLDRNGLRRCFGEAMARLEEFDLGVALVVVALDDLAHRLRHDAGGGRAHLQDVCRRLRDALPLPCVVARHGRHDLAILLWNVPESVARITAMACESLIAASHADGVPASAPVRARAGVTMLQRSDDLPFAMARAEADIFARGLDPAGGDGPCAEADRARGARH